MSRIAIISAAPAPSSDKLLAAIFIAIIVHVGIILGVSFTVEKPQKFNKSISITLANTPAEKAPEKANFLAQENQIGAGRKKQKATPPAQKIPSQKQTRHVKINKQKQSKNKAANKVRIITQKQSTIKSNIGEQSETPRTQNIPELSTAMLRQQITEIGVNVRDRQLNAENSRIKFIDSVNAHKFQAATYIQQWQHKVERIGNLNYPALARKKGFSGKLLLDVGIKHDGSIYSIRVRKSSGYKSLDDTATKIVRMGAPYAPLPGDLRAELDVLVISRVWHFSDEAGMSTQ